MDRFSPYMNHFKKYCSLYSHYIVQVLKHIQQLLQISYSVYIQHVCRAIDLVPQFEVKLFKQLIHLMSLIPDKGKKVSPKDVLSFSIVNKPSIYSNHGKHYGYLEGEDCTALTDTVSITLSIIPVPLGLWNSMDSRNSQQSLLHRMDDLSSLLLIIGFP